MGVKICAKCNVEKSGDDFSRRADTASGLYSWCKECRRARWREYYAKGRNQKRRELWRNDPEYKDRNRIATKKYRDSNKELLREKQKKAVVALRLSVINKYGGECKCCSETAKEFLVIDHIHGGGGIERRKLKGSHKLYRQLRDTDVQLDKYRVLCHNCNASLAFYGYCPHHDKL